MPTHRKLLGIFAHPDDESFGPGATLARYARTGAEVHVIIATDGIAGSLEDPSHLQDHDSLAQVRSAELARAAVALGIAAVWSLPYRDSGMRGAADNQHPAAFIRQPLEHTTEEILGYLRRLRPQVIVTHDPYGGYGHPDHVRVCEATTAAFYLARAQGAQGKNDGWAGPQKLYYTAFPKWLIKFFVRTMPLFRRDPTAFGRNGDINLVEISQWDTPVTARIDVAAYLLDKQAASEAHASQFSGGPSWIRALPGPLRRRVLEHELFTRAFPAPTAGMEADLFTGVTLSG